MTADKTRSASLSLIPTRRVNATLDSSQLGVSVFIFLAMNLNRLNLSHGDGNASQAPEAITGDASPYVPEPQVSRIIRFVILAILFMVAIAGNATICIIPMRRKRMRTCTYILITNLAVSDIGTMLCLPYIILAEWQENEWTLGEVMCRLVNPSLTMFYIVTTNTLVAIAAHRFFVLVFPFRSKPSKTKTALVVLLTWLVAFLCVLPSFGARELSSLGTKPNGETAYACIETFPGKTAQQQEDLKNMYNIFQYVINSCLPIVIIVALYLAIAYKLRQMSSAFGSFTSERRDSEGTISLQSTASKSRSRILLGRKSSVDNYPMRKRNELEKKFLRMLAVVVAIFVICYVPYTTFFLVISHFPAAYDWKYLLIFYHYIYLLMWFPNALNPICYGCLDEHYGKALRVWCSLQHKPRKSDFDKHLQNSIAKNSRFYRTNSRTMPPIMEQSNSQAASSQLPGEERNQTSRKKWWLLSRR